MVSNPNFQRPKPGRPGSYADKGPLLYLLGAIVVVAIIAFLSVRSSTSVNQLSSAQTFTIPLNGSQYFSLPNSTAVYSIFLKSASNSIASFYLSGEPILVKPIFLVTLAPLGSDNLSTTNGAVANVHVTLQSSSASQATVTLTPLAATLGTRVTGGIVIINPAQLLNGQSLTSSETTTGGAVTTTVTTTTTTTAATTTVSAGISSGQISQVMMLINNTPTGAVMKGLAPLYAQASSCTPSVYNSTYSAKYGSAPTGPNSYFNVSPYATTGVSWIVSNFSTNVYNATYTITAQKSVAAGKVLVLQINTATGLIVPPQRFIGPWAPLNYTILNAQYNFAKGISNNCATVIPYVLGH